MFNLAELFFQSLTSISLRLIGLNFRLKPFECQKPLLQNSISDQKLEISDRSYFHSGLFCTLFIPYRSCTKHFQPILNSFWPSSWFPTFWFVRCLCPESSPGGDQVDGLPPASSCMHLALVTKSLLKKGQPIWKGLKALFRITFFCRLNLVSSTSVETRVSQMNFFDERSGREWRFCESFSGRFWGSH